MTAKKVNAEPIDNNTTAHADTATQAQNTLTAEDIKMRKPLVIARNEFLQNLIQAANDSGLPFAIMEYVVRDFYDEVRKSASQQYENEKKEYDNLLAQYTESSEESEVK